MLLKMKRTTKTAIKNKTTFILIYDIINWMKIVSYKLKIIFIIILCLSIFIIKSPKLVFSPFQITPLSPVYPFKIAREYFQSLFVFGDEDLAYFNLTLADKRLKEAEVLQRNQQYILALKQLNMAKNYQSIANEYTKILKDKVDINYLLTKSFDISARINMLSK